MTLFDIGEQVHAAKLSGVQTMEMSLSGATLLRVGAALSFAAAALHIAIIFGGASWYRFFGAGEQMALASEAGKLFPHFITLGIAIVLGSWGLYALSGSGDVICLPLLKTALVLITTIYLVRGLVFAPIFWTSGQYSASFMIWSSLISLSVGVVHLTALTKLWASL